MAKTFKCPNCGAPLDYDGGDKLTVECPFCSNVVIVPEELRPARAAAAPTPPLPPVEKVPSTPKEIRTKIREERRAAREKRRELRHQLHNIRHHRDE